MSEPRQHDELIATIVGYGFKPCGTAGVSADAARLVYEKPDESLNAPSVYAIVGTRVVDSEEKSQTWYVGSTFRGWAKRYRDHNGGNRRVAGLDDSKSAKIKYMEQLKFLKDGGLVSIYERPSGFYSVLGRKTSAHEAEESIFIDLLRPVYNRQKGGRSSPDSTSVQICITM